MARLTSQALTLIAPEPTGLSRVRDLCGWPRGGCGSIALVEGRVLDRGNNTKPPTLHTKLMKYHKCVSFGPLTGAWAPSSPTGTGFSRVTKHGGVNLATYD
ncbi:unnamed protein product [Macrosiphum euphorbiae]|uniref:Uncharacterized protein n=1 Tax=Macrosiphum euphorbiae TaxID=13131 RepID=A0AAV0WP73_9HEMI|nr:unnamed protein product [Macrosiphum euphorbiae]